MKNDALERKPLICLIIAFGRLHLLVVGVIKVMIGQEMQYPNAGNGIVFLVVADEQRQFKQLTKGCNNHQVLKQHKQQCQLFHHTRQRYEKKHMPDYGMLNYSSSNPSMPLIIQSIAEILT